MVKYDSRVISNCYSKLCLYFIQFIWFSRAIWIHPTDTSGHQVDPQNISWRFS